jgi:penicillin amidase
MHRLLPLLLLTQSCALFDLAAIRKSFPTVDGELTVEGLDAAITIRRDAMGVPHVRATTEHDAWFGQGFVHGQDRYWQADLLRRLAFGDVGVWLGESAGELDIFMRTMRTREIAEAMAASQTPEVTAMIDAYVDGINAGIGSIDTPPIEYRLLNTEPEPWTATDVFGVVLMQSWNLTANPEEELSAWLMKDIDPELLDRLYHFHPSVPPLDDWWDTVRTYETGPFTAAFDAFGNALGGRPSPAASNNWVIGGARTASGLPILANDPHLVQSVPSLWYVADVAGGDLHVAGASLPGLPGFPVGHNGETAWGLTNVMADVADFALLERVGADGYLLEGEQRTFDRETLTVPTSGEDVTREVLRTEIGPVITTDGDTSHVMVMRWHALESEDHTPEALYNLAHASGVQDFLDVARRPLTLAQNLVLADTAGDWAWQSVGRVPVRRAQTGRVPYDASDPAYGWDGWYPVLMGERAPERGYVVTANAFPQSDRPADGGDEVVDREGISSVWIPPHRYDRIEALIEDAPEPLTAADVAVQQKDVHDRSADELLPLLLSRATTDTPEGERCRDHLAGWDREMGVDSLGAAVWSRFTEALIRRLLDPLLSDEHVDLYLGSVSPARSFLHYELLSFLDGNEAAIGEALHDTCVRLEEELGRKEERWNWGDLHPLQLEHPVASGRSLLNKWHLPVVPMGGNGSTVDANGFGYGSDPESPVTGMPSLRFVIDLADPANATLSYPGGQSGHPRHPDTESHFHTFVDGETSPLWFDDDDVAANTEHTLEVRP